MSEEVLELIFYVGVLIVILTVGHLSSKYSCHKQATMMGLQYEHALFSGCMVKTSSGWIDIDKVRDVER